MCSRDEVQWGDDQERVARDKVKENTSQRLPDHVAGESDMVSVV